MFRAGQRYKIRMIIDGTENMIVKMVEEYEPPLLKFHDQRVQINDQTSFTYKGEIINVTSPNFISAQPVE